MLCPICRSARATEKIERVVEGTFVEGAVCHDCCRRAYGLDGRSFYYLFVTLPQKACPSCGRTYEQFSKTLLLGCPHCYKAFESELKPLVESIQAK